MEMINGTTIDKLPLCGVMAVANCAGIAIQDAFEAFKAKFKLGGSWKGRTNCGQLSAMLKYYGVKYRATKVDQKVNLARFVDYYTAKGRRYMVRTGNHCQYIENGIITDQRGSFPISEFWGKRKMVTHLWVIK